MRAFVARRAYATAAALLGVALWAPSAVAAPIATPPRPVTDPRSVESPSVPGFAPPSLAELRQSAQSWDAAVTPDGRDLIYTADPSGRMNLWRVSLAGGAAVRLVVSDERQFGIAISPDSNTVVYSQDIGGAEMFDIYAVPRAGGEPVNLTGTPEATENGARFSPDGRWLGYGQRLRTAPSANVAVLELSSRKVRVLTDERAPDRQWTVVAFSADGRHVYASRSDIVATESELWKIEIESGKAQRVIRNARSKLNLASDVTPDGRYVALTTETAAGVRQAAVYDTSSGRLTLLAPSPWEQSASKFSDDGRALLFVTNADGRHVVQSYDLQSRTASAVPLPPGANADYFGSLPAYAAGRGIIVFPHQSGSRSIDYWVHEVASGRSRRVTTLASEAATRLPETRVVTYASFDGTLVSAVLWVPANAKRDGRNAAVVLAHGGPTRQTADRYDADAVALASRGYFVIAPNPRGSTGYGRAFTAANVRDLGGGDLQDYVWATRFLSDTGYVDPGRIGIMGTSYGGYMTIMALGRTPDTFAAGVETCGITNWTSMYERGSPALRSYQEGLIGHPVKDKEVYESTSPLTYLGQVKAPLLVIQGDNDIRVPKFEAEQVAATLASLGKTVDARYYADEGHGLMKRENQLDALQRTLAWFDRYLKRQDEATDALQWLEAPREPKALAWAREQTARSTAALGSSPSYAPILAELTAAQSASVPAAGVTLLGPRAVRMYRDGAHPHGLLQVARRSRTSLGPWKTVLDVGALREKEGKPYELQWYGTGSSTCAAPKFARCLLRLSPGGGDEAELREFDLDAARFVAGGYRVPSSRVMTSWLDADHLLIAHTLGGEPLTAAGWGANVRLWRRGEPLESATVVYTAQPTDALVQVASVGASTGVRGVIIRVIDFSTFEMKLVDAGGRLTDVALPTKLKAFGLLGSTQQALVVQLSEPAEIEGQKWPAETLLAYDVSAVDPGRRVTAIHVPKPGEYLNDPFFGLATTRDAVHFVLTRSLVPRLVTATRTAGGWQATDMVVAAAGESLRSGGGDPASSAVVVETSGFLTPTRQEIRAVGARAVPVYTEAAAFDASRFMVERRTTRAKDGVEIDYFLLRPKTIPAGKPVPTLMTGYGAFGISLSPGYLDFAVGGRSLTVWLSRGGALALPAIRGGGERGAEWHRAAMRERRQVSYDDFAAVAEDLIATGFTKPQHLGVFGLSNGGLLSATMGLQRPDLFSAVVSDVPLADMLRFPKMGMGAAWMEEYGNPEDPAAAAVLRSYSPLHLVREGGRYPQFLVTISTEDNRVGPGHARKLAARLMQVGVPTYFLEDDEGGHGVSDPLSRPEIVAKRMAFLVDTLMKD